MNILRYLWRCIKGERCGPTEADHDRLRELDRVTKRAERQTEALRRARESGLTRGAALDSFWGNPPGR